MRTINLAVLTFVGLCLSLLPIRVNAQTAASVRLAWDANPVTDEVTGYRLYYGPKSQTYTNTTDVGSVTTATITTLAPGTTYFFAVTAYNASGLESDYSNEVSYTPSPVPTALTAISSSPGKVRLRFTYGGGAVTYSVYTNGVVMLTAAATVSPVTVDLVGIVPGQTFLTQVALVDPISGEQPKSTVIPIKLPGVVPNIRRQ